MLVVDGVRYRLWKPSSEEEYESLVVKNAKHIFGEGAVFFNLKTRLKSFGGVGSIPDGFIVYTGAPSHWCIVEVELSTHQVYEHIIVQLNKFIDGYKGPDGKRSIVKALDDEIRGDPYLKALFSEKIGEEVHRFLSDLVDHDPKVVVVIDEKTAKIAEACGRIPEVKEVREFRVYEREDVGAKTAFLMDAPVDGLAPVKPEPGAGGSNPKQPSYRPSGSRGANTKQSEYAFPILESIVELGGSGKVSEVLFRVHEKMKDRLTQADHDTYPSGNAIRWENKAKWERNRLKNEGYLKPNSPFGYWEITDKGREYLKTR